MNANDYKANIYTLFSVLIRKLWIILIISAATAAAVAVATIYLVKPVYSSSALFYVYNDSSNASQAVSSSDLNAAQSLVDTYIVILKSNTVLSRVAETAQVSYSPEKILSMMQAGSKSGTEAFYVSISSTDNEEALRITQAIVENAPQAIMDVVKAGGVSIVDYPQLDTVKDSPNVRLNTVIGFLAAFLISYTGFFLREVLDNTVYSEEDLKGRFNYPVIGQIPSIEPQETAALSTNKSKQIKKEKTAIVSKASKKA